jgi:hypothetical protein
MSSLSSSFSEEKEAKRLYPLGAAPGDWRPSRPQVAKVFCFFFTKKKNLPSCLGVAFAC